MIHQTDLFVVRADWYDQTNSSEFSETPQNVFNNTTSCGFVSATWLAAAVAGNSSASLFPQEAVARWRRHRRRRRGPEACWDRMCVCVWVGGKEVRWCWGEAASAGREKTHREEIASPDQRVQKFSTSVTCRFCCISWTQTVRRSDCRPTEQCLWSAVCQRTRWIRRKHLCEPNQSRQRGRRHPWQKPPLASEFLNTRQCVSPCHFLPGSMLLSWITDLHRPPRIPTDPHRPPQTNTDQYRPVQNLITFSRHMKASADVYRSALRPLWFSTDRPKPSRPPRPPQSSPDSHQTSMVLHRHPPPHTHTHTFVEHL